MIEDRLREHFAGQYEAIPPSQHRLPLITQRGRRRTVLRRSTVGAAAAATVLVLVLGSGWLGRIDQAMATSPFSGEELPVINETPLMLQGELGPRPVVDPPGVDLTFRPIEEPTANDLAAIEEIVRREGYSDPVVVALGRIEAFETNIYALHQVDPETGRGQSQVVAIGPEYPSFVSHAGPFESEQTGWGPSSSRGLDGDGHARLRIPEYATWQYAQLQVDGETFWQRPSDGFIWIPFEADLDSTIILTAHDPKTGEALLRFPINE